MKNSHQNNKNEKPVHSQITVDEELTTETGLTEQEREQLKGPIRPDKFSFDRLYKNIDESSKNCRKILLIYTGFLSYTLLTVITTSDLNIILGHKAKLPIINTAVPYDLFIIIAPFLAIFFFVYILLCLTKIDNLIEYLITKCKDLYGDDCDEKPKCKLNKENKVDIQNICQLQQNYLYPWIIISSKHSENPVIGVLQRLFVKFSLWWLLPILLMTISLFVIKKHESIPSYALLCTALGGTIIVIAFWHKLDKSKYLGKSLLFIVVFGFCIVTSILIPAANMGWLSSNKYAPNDFHLHYLRYLKKFTNVDLSEKILITKPEGAENFNTLHWANLQGTHLEGADLASTILVKANLKESHLEYANLVGANLENANLAEAHLNFTNLGEAILNNANLNNANLKKSDLVGAKLEKAVLNKANLENADLQGAFLKSAIISRANLSGAQLQFSILCEANLSLSKLNSAKLQKANLNGADLCSANLQGADLREAEFKEAVLHSAQLVEADLSSGNLQKAVLFKTNFKDANLQKADLREAKLMKANLSGADLKNADLRGANFRGTVLTGANLQKADLRGLIFSDHNQFADVKTLYQSKLDETLGRQLKTKYPYLFDYPSQ